MTTTIFPRPTGTPILPEVQLGEREATASIIPQPITQISGSHHRTLSQDEWKQFCRGVGVFKDDESDTAIRPTSWFWPLKGLPEGLYSDILREKLKFTYWYHIVAFITWTLMILQLAINAVLTALGATKSLDIAVTTLAGVNTMFAGVLALLHNSGLPDRYRSNRDEFAKVEEHLKEIIDTRIVLVDDTIVEVVATCFDQFAAARQSVKNNVPQSYIPAISTTTTTTGKR